MKFLELVYIITRLNSQIKEICLYASSILRIIRIPMRPRTVYKPRRPKKTFSIAYLNTFIVNAYLDTTIWVWKENSINRIAPTAETRAQVLLTLHN